MQVVVRCERVSHLDLCTLERQSLCESHRQRRWLTCWSYAERYSRYNLKTHINTHTARLARLEEEAGCFVLLTNVPTAGDMAHSARDILTVYKDQHGTEQNYGFLKDPVIVNSLFLKKPERIEALGLILLLALLLWRLM